ncbi:MAG: alpha-1,2-fucosyltransferase [Lachnospiraceae bacterium]|jgi:hypothetical protein|nr:alpha-1,2-fucosyltransferase [Lachnospiraceae bacterium]
MIIVRMWEGLGNQMFQYAYARFLSQTGQQVYLDLNKTYDEFFDRDKRQSNREVMIHNFNILLGSVNIENRKRYKYLKRHTLADRLIFDMAKRGRWFYNFWDENDAEDSFVAKGNCYVKGWFQEPFYCDNIREILLREFTPKKKIRITPKLRYFIHNKQTVSVHIRRTDYEAIHNTLGWEYYEKAFSKIEESYKDPVYVVFSDDYLWVKDYMPSKKNVYYISENEKLMDYEELLVMSCCSSNIIANSTFSWWAAWLNKNPDKIVIMPRKWLKGQEKLMKRDWIILG